MPDLNDHLRDVQPDPSPGMDDDLHDPDLVDDKSLDPQLLDDEPADSDKGRTLDNVRGELMRKLDGAGKELRDQQQEFQRQIMDKLAELTTQLVSRTQQETPATGQNQIEQMSSQELASLRAQVPEGDTALRDQLEQAITQKIIEEHVSAELSAFKTQQTVDQKRVLATEKAARLYPELHDPTSDFRRKVESRLNERGESWAANNPYAVLDVANEVAADEGIQVSAVRTTQRRVQGPSATRKNAAPVVPKQEQSISDEEAGKIAAKLQGAMPGKKFDINRIKQLHQIYSDNSDLFVR